jgi:hypothetical protein
VKNWLKDTIQRIETDRTRKAQASAQKRVHPMPPASQ